MRSGTDYDRKGISESRRHRYPCSSRDDARSWLPCLATSSALPIHVLPLFSLFPSSKMSSLCRARYACALQMSFLVFMVPKSSRNLIATGGVSLMQPRIMHLCTFSSLSSCVGLTVRITNAYWMGERSNPGIEEQVSVLPAAMTLIVDDP